MSRKGLIVPSLIGLGLSVLYLRSPLSKVNLIEKKQVKADQVKEIQVNAASVNLEILPTTGDDIVLTLEGARNKFICQPDLIQVKQHDTKLVFDFLMKQNILKTIDGSKYQMQAKLEIPNDKLQAMQVFTSSGDIYLRDIIADQAVIYSTSGDQKIKSLKAEQGFMAKALSGDLYLRDIETGKAVCRANSGDIFVENEVLNMDLDLTSSSGDVTTKFAQVPRSLELDFQAVSGEHRIRIDDVSYDHQTKQAVIGRKGEEEYQVKVRTGSGDFMLA